MEGQSHSTTPLQPPPPATGDRALAALAYAGPFFLVTILRGAHSPFLRFHARQGFGLFLGECFLLGVWIVLSRTVGQIPFLGIVVLVVADIVFVVSVVVLIAVGVVKALAAEKTPLPFVGRWVDAYLP